MSSGYGRNGGAQPGSTKNRKRNKKYGLNLYQLQKGGPAAPPVPSITTSVQAKPSNGLLLLSKKSSTGGASLLAGKESINDGQSKQTENDALFAKAQGGDGHGGGVEGEPSKVAIPAWGNKVDKQSVDLSMEELTLKSTAASQLNDQDEALKYDEKTSLLILAPKGSLPKQKPALSTSDMTAEKNDEQKQVLTSNKPTENDQQKQYMSKLAKDRASRLKSEEEARITQQRERAAKRLEDLEAKRLDQKKKQVRQPKQKKTHRHDGPPLSITIGKDVPTRPPIAVAPSKIYSRKEFSQPSTVLEPLGKPKKVLTHSDNLASNKSETIEAKNEKKKKLYDPNRPYSSLVGGKSKPEAKSCGSVKSGISEESSAAKDSRSSHEKASLGIVSKPPAVKEKQSSTSVRMMTLSSFGDRDRGVVRGVTSGAGPRMLFDPTSGSLVAAPSGEMNHQQQLSPVNGAKSGLKKSSMSKPPIGSSKIDPKQKQLQKKLDNKSRSPTKKSKPRFPHTRGIKYKKDERGNYISIDQCEADCGYGQHSVPGGRIKNATAYAKLSEQNIAIQQQKKSNKLNADAPAFFGFQIQKDSTSLQQQTDFEAQQQRILEDAWASLEEAAPSHEELHTEEDIYIPQKDKAAKNQEDEYVAALAISPTMIGLSPGKEDEPFDVSKFALESDSTGLPTNRFNSLGGGGSRLLGSSTWGASASANTGATLGEIAGLSGWNFDPKATDFTPSSENTDAIEAGANQNIAEQSATNNTFINLNGWGSSTFDSFAFGGKNHDNSKESG